MDKTKIAKLKTYGITVKEYETVEKIFTDPATVIAIAETGYKIYTMFRKKRTGPSAEIIYLKKIYAEIRDMQNDLNIIILLLKDLKIYINESQINYIANSLSSKINTANLFLIGWLENKRGDLEQQFSSIHENKSLLGMYGFAHIHVYMLAFHMELELCHWLKKGKNFTDTLLQESKSYFLDALNSNYRQETPAKRLAAITKEIDMLRASFPLGDFSEDIRIILPKLNPCGADGYRDMHYTLRISGTMETSFTFTWSEAVKRIVSPTREHCGSTEGGGGGGVGRGKSLELSAFPAPRLNEMISRYSEGQVRYVNLLKSKLELEATVTTIKSMVKLIDDYYA